MTKHKKIEWSLFVLGLIGLFISIYSAGDLVEKVLFALIAIFSGLQVFHLFAKANTAVVLSSAALALYTIYLLIIYVYENDYNIYLTLVISILLLFLSLALRRDFIKR